MSEQSHSRAIFIASFLTLIAAGIGFAIRGSILNDWSAQFGFTKGDLGTITGGGLTGFGITIIICSLFADKLGYKPLLAGAFVLHVLSAVVTLAATPVFAAAANADEGRHAAYWCLFVGMFMFALANGLCEAVINPLVATLYPNQKTHYLNILHAGWPGGLILGGLLAYAFAGGDAAIMRLRWEIPMSFFLVPTLIYGLITLKEEFPLSEARAAGVKFGQMLLQFASPLLLSLLLLHAMVGYVELGTDSWISNIMKNVTEHALLLFVYTSGIMFVLRFFAGPIVERINPLGLLFVSAVLGCAGLYSLSFAEGATAIIAAATVYGVGKTFLWPTMLGVVGERFPQGGALTMGAMGGIGMLSAGLLGAPAIGYKQDYYASQELKQLSEETYERYAASEAKSPLPILPPIAGLDGQKVGALQDKVDNLKLKEHKHEAITDSDRLTPTEEKDKGPVLAAGIYGGRMALRWTAAVPGIMAVGYLLLILYFRATGGYKTVHITAESSH
jgi:MFS family permease